MLKKLPIGYSSLNEIISGACVYVDKTPHVYRLTTGGKYYFLSRPRRFGKSLFIDTLKQAFLGNHNLFQGLYLEKNWDWSQTYPVIHLDFAAGIITSRAELDHAIHRMFHDHCEKYALKTDDPNIAIRFENLILALKQKYQQNVVILIDEYDKPILDNIDKTELAIELREGLKNCYSVIKKCDAAIKFVLITGVSKFSKVSLFSGLNNLNDITLNEKYADICGYTQTELHQSFNAYLQKVDPQQLKYWYNGYNFAGKSVQNVYNPFDILLFIENGQQFKNYWIQSGNPSFLLKLLQKNQYYLPDIEQLTADDTLLDSFDIEQLAIIPLLFQTGYLTIKNTTTSAFDQTVRYVLDYPNHEVRMSLNTQLIHYFVNDAKLLDTSRSQMETALLTQNFDLFKTTLSQFLASIPYAWYTHNKLPHYEGFYATLVYSLLNAMGLDAIPEDTTNRGRIDLSVKILDQYYLLFEFKVQKQATAQSALQQIKDRRYPEKYAAQGLPIYLVGLIFDEEARNVVDFAWEQWAG